MLKKIKIVEHADMEMSPSHPKGNARYRVWYIYYIITWFKIFLLNGDIRTCLLWLSLGYENGSYILSVTA